ncbi:hypothetical protein B0H17DRAFT_1131280 [Mycena rosella]|uniref:Uncharacterized protein n=1 Tax=Mycena rosella TaxID=1033263 RepID=A0AAD7DNM1_MYCRO|nr:hypothetical protein B0H17DRAFT_1131280 [Mycena rosella]
MNTFEEAKIVVSASVLPGGVRLKGDIPGNISKVYVHVPDTIPKPLRTPTDWHLHRGDKEVDSLFTSSNGKNSRALRYLGVAFPLMKTLGHEANLVFLMKHFHGPLDREKWALYFPMYTFIPDNPNSEIFTQKGKITAQGLQLYQFKDSDDFAPGKHTLQDALIAVNTARKSTPVATVPFMKMDAPPHPPLVYMYTEADPLELDGRIEAIHPHPITWRLHYAVTCILTWGSDEIKALAYEWNTLPKEKKAKAKVKQRLSASSYGDGDGNGRNGGDRAGGTNKGGGNGDNAGSGGTADSSGGGGGTLGGSMQKRRKTAAVDSAKVNNFYLRGGVPMSRSVGSSSGSGSGTGSSRTGSSGAPDHDIDFTEVSDDDTVLITIPEAPYGNEEERDGEKERYEEEVSTEEEEEDSGEEGKRC